MLATLSGNYFQSITLQPKVAYIQLNRIISGRFTKSIIQAMSFKNSPILSMMTPSSNSRIWRRGGTATRKNNLTHCGSVLGMNPFRSGLSTTRSLGECFSHSPHPFGNEYLTIVCAIFKVIYSVDIVEGKDYPQGMGSKEFYYNGLMLGLMFHMSNPL